jgi:hypothetical protein
VVVSRKLGVRSARRRAKPPCAQFCALCALSLALGACGSTHATRSSATRSAALAASPAVASLAAPERLKAAVQQALRAYRRETRGSKLQRETARIASDPLLLKALARGDVGHARAAVHAQLFAPANHFSHVTRIGVTRGGRVLVNATLNHDGTFVVAPARRELIRHGQRVGTLLVSIQDVTGFVRLVHRVTLADVVARGSSGQVRTSLAAAARARLPVSGPAQVAGRSYLVRSFHERAWGGEPLTVWILAPA